MNSESSKMILIAKRLISPSLRKISQNFQIFFISKKSKTLCRHPFLLSFFLSLTSCSSFFIRQQCDKINWYQQGYDIALRGERLSSDDMVNKCRKAEADMSESQLDLGFKEGMSRYCQPDGAFKTGRNGDSFNIDFCDSGSLPRLTQKYQEGLKQYCQNGEEIGSSGRVYKNTCPAELEKIFLPPYKKARVKYLKALVDSKSAQLQMNERSLASEREVTKRNEYRKALLPYVESGKPDQYQNERSYYENIISSSRSTIYRLENENRNLLTEIGNFKTEINALQ